MRSGKTGLGRCAPGRPASGPGTSTMEPLGTAGHVTSSGGGIRSAGRGQAGGRPGLALDETLAVPAALTVADEKQGAWSLHDAPDV